MPPPPIQKRDIEIAILCALPLEASAVRATFDELGRDLDGPMDGDVVYTPGKIGAHSVVLVHMSDMGTNAAAAVASTLKQSFKGIELALLVGICGGVPRHQPDKIMLGDVIIGRHVVQYDFGRQYPDQFSRKADPEDTLGRQRPKVRAFVKKLESGREDLAKKSFDHLTGLRSKLGVDHPINSTALRDILFPPAYWHMHDKPENCERGICKEGEEICDHARHSSCDEVGCERAKLERNDKPKVKPDIHFGRVASGNTVIRCGEERDRLAEAERIIAFEMEAAGVWDYLPCVVVKGVCDYADSHKNKTWQDYAAFAAAACTKAILEQWPRKQGLQDKMELPATQDNQTNTDFDFGDSKKEAHEYMAFLASDYREHKDRNPERVPGTCNWFLNHHQFLEWRSDKSPNLLWVSADPGCGKSVLSRVLIDEGHLNKDASYTTCYFFFKEDDTNRRSGADALCAILHQLFTKKRRLLLRHGLEPWKNNGAKLRTQFGTLWDILMKATTDHDADDNSGWVICILDALDECGQAARKSLIEKLSRFYVDRHQTKSRLKFVVTSRPYHDILAEFRYNIPDLPDLPSIHLKGNAESKAITQEIDLYIEHEIPRIANARASPLPLSIQENLVKHLKQMENRTYLWLHLVLDQIKTSLEFESPKIERLLKKLPSSVADAYDNILKRVTTEERRGERVPNQKRVQEVRRLLHIIVAAERPLTLREMNVALDILEMEHEDDPYRYDTSWDAEDPDFLDKFKQKVRNLCGLFVSVKDSKVYLIHQTAREFLITNNPPQSSSTSELVWEHSLWLAESHRLLASACISYIGLPIFEDDSLPAETYFLGDWCERYSFLDYAANHWVSHVKLEGEGAIPQPSKLAQLACSVWATRHYLLRNWLELQRLYNDHEFEWLRSSWTDLVVASCFSLGPVVSLLADRRGAVGPGAVDLTTALHVAAANGQEGIVRLLLEKGILSSSTDVDGLTPLHMAAIEGHERTVRLLLDKGAPINIQTTDGHTALHMAVMYNQMPVLRLLVERRADVYVQSSNGTTALSMAIEAAMEVDLSENDHAWIIMEILLRSVADWRVEAREWEGVLADAAGQGHETVVQLLLDRGHDVEEEFIDGITPLMMAARSGHESVVQLLMENNANVDAISDDGHTALVYAAEDGHLATAKKLIENGADVHVGAALISAAKNGHLALAKMLIDNGANVDAIDWYGRTALLYASEKGHLAVAKLLIENGADIKYHAD